jgi:hypothetical protein
MKLRFTDCRTIVPEAPDVAWSAYAVAARETKGLPEGEVAQRGEARAVAPAALSAVEREQLCACVQRCFGAPGPLSVEGIFAPDRDRGTDEAEFADMPVEWWDVVDDDDRARYQLWLYHVDCGSLFEAGEARVLADVIQFGFTWPENPEAWRALADAHGDACGLYPDSMLASMDLSVDEP